MPSRSLAAATLAALLLGPGAHAATPLDGAWDVDLTTDPATPYLKRMVVRTESGGTLAGAFYDSTILAGRWTTARGRACVSFRTTDGRGPYHTSACLVGDRLEGQTWAEHRNFLFVWTAARPAPTVP